MKGITFPLALLISLALQAQTRVWQTVKENEIRLNGKRQIVPEKYNTWRLNTGVLLAQLKLAPGEGGGIQNSTCIIELPLPGAGTQRFRVVESPVMAEGLANAYPDIKTYSIKGIDDPYASGKLDVTPFGFHGMVMSVNGDFFIDPYSAANLNEYISYYTSDFRKDPSQVLPEVGVIGMDEKRKPAGAGELAGAKMSPPPAICTGSLLRVYDLAIACTGEYAMAATGLTAPTVAQTLAKIVTSVNRVDGVYEKELAVRMVLVATETNVVFTDPASDPFTGNNNSNILLNESQTVINANIGAANYDIGHTFSTGGGGLASWGCLCNNTSKAEGITGSPSPVGDPYDIDYVAHEMGHQMRGSHTFNAITGSCNGNRDAGAAAEPGSGITIMAYAGICGSNDMGTHSIPYFHAISYDEIVNFVHTGSGGACAVTLTTGNLPPVVTGPGDFTIPKSTPFILTGSGTDPDNDPITFSWEEADIAPTAGNWNSGNPPYFKSYAPVTGGTRLFPTKTVAFNGNFTGTKGEYVPPYSQYMNFRLTARDNKMGGGGVCYSTSHILVDTSGPFRATYPDAPSITWLSGSQQIVTWNVNWTNFPPVSCDSVRISLTFDNGTTYTVLAASTENDGSEIVTVPTVSAAITTCRLRIASANNIFYDMGNNVFTISLDPNAGIRDISRNNPLALTIWPNPSAGKFNVEARVAETGYPAEIRVTNLLGQTLLSRGITGKEVSTTLDLSDFKNGVYFIYMLNGPYVSVHKAVKE